MLPLLPLLSSAGSGAIGLLKRPWVIVSIVLFLLLGVQEIRVRGKANTILKRDNQILSLEASIREQNIRIGEWMGAAVEAENRALSARKKAISERKAHEEKIRLLLSEPIPSDCAGAVAWGAAKGAALSAGWGEP